MLWGRDSFVFQSVSLSSASVRCLIDFITGQEPFSAFCDHLSQSPSSTWYPSGFSCSALFSFPVRSIFGRVQSWCRQNYRRMPLEWLFVLFSDRPITPDRFTDHEPVQFSSVLVCSATCVADFSSYFPNLFYLCWFLIPVPSDYPGDSTQAL